MSSSNPAELLERGEVIHHPVCPFALPSVEDRTFLAVQRQGGKLHKNISYDPVSARLHGIGGGTAAESKRLSRILAEFSQSVANWLAEAIPTYARDWEIDRVSYRPLEEATRKLRKHACNDLLHVDAFPTRPTNGRRILRVFANLNFTEPRVWITSEPFAVLFERYGKQAGLPTRGLSFDRLWSGLKAVPRLFRPERTHSDYDEFMHRFHNCLKGNETFQETAPKRLWSFAPGSAWLAMTDCASHAVLRGRHALEHSFFISPTSLALPDESPAAILSRACGFPVLRRAA